MEIDDVIRSVGDFGRGQVLIFLCVCLVSPLPAAWHIFAITFLGASPSHHCAAPSNFEENDYLPLEVVGSEGEAVYSSCFQFEESVGHGNVTVPCQNGWTYSGTPYGTTIVTEWDLVCDRGRLSALSQSIMMLGVILGSFMFGYISDRFGRKRVLVVSLFSQGCLGVIQAFSPSYMFFVVVRFFMGIFDQGYELPGYTITSEMFTPKGRPYALPIFLTFWAAGIMTFPILAYFIRDWRQLQLAISIPFFLFHILAWLLPESPRWLVSVGRFEEAKKVFAKIAKLNGRKVNEMVFMRQKQFEDYGVENEAFKSDEDNDNVEKTIKAISCDLVDKEKEEGGMTEMKEKERPSVSGETAFTYLFKTRRMSQVTIVMMILWFVTALAYYGVSLTSVNLVGDPYVNLFLSGAVEIPSHWISAAFAVWFGRRRPICVLLIFAGIACVGTGYIPEKSASGIDLTPLTVTIAMLGKFFVTSAYTLVTMCATETFPTVVRTKGIGLAGVAARIGSLIAPLIILTSEVYTDLPMTFFGCIAIGPSFLVFFLPEMRGRKQPQDLEDIDTIFEEDKLKAKLKRAKNFSDK